MPCAPPRIRGPFDSTPAPATLSLSLADIYLTPAHNHLMGCLHAHEHAAPYLPLQSASYQKINTPHPPYTPMGYVFRPPQPCRLFRINNLQNTIIATTSKKGRISATFRSNSRAFRAVPGIFRGVAEVHLRWDNATGERRLRSTPGRKATSFGIELPQLADLHL